MGGGYSSVVISSRDSGFTWNRYSIIYQAPDNIETFIGSVFKIGNEYALYYTCSEYGTTNPIEYKYTISFDPVSFDVEGAFPVNDSIMGINYNTIIQLRNKYLIFYKEKIDNKNVILMMESEDLSFANASEPKIIMCPGISQYDLYDITPFFYFNEESSELYCMAIVDPRERQDYGFDNDSSICLYKAPVTF